STRGKGRSAQPSSRCGAMNGLASDSSPDQAAASKQPTRHAVLHARWSRLDSRPAAVSSVGNRRRMPSSLPRRGSTGWRPDDALSLGDAPAAGRLDPDAEEKGTHGGGASRPPSTQPPAAAARATDYSKRR